jgi:hypothetical protein
MTQCQCLSAVTAFVHLNEVYVCDAFFLQDILYTYLHMPIVLFINFEIYYCEQDYYLSVSELKGTFTGVVKPKPHHFNGEGAVSLES